MRGRDNHEKGQFYIPIVDIFERPGRSDLAVVKLKHQIEEHEDYGLGAKLFLITLAREPPKSGKVIISPTLMLHSAHFKNEGVSSELRSLNFTITTVTLISETFFAFFVV